MSKKTVKPKAKKKSPSDETVLEQAAEQKKKAEAKEMTKVKKEAEKRAKEAEKARKEAEKAQAKVEALKAKERAQDPRGRIILNSSPAQQKESEEAIWAWLFDPQPTNAEKAIMSWAGSLCRKAFRKENPGKLKMASQAVIRAPFVVAAGAGELIETFKQGFRDGQAEAKAESKAAEEAAKA